MLKIKSGHSVFGAGNPGPNIETVLSVYQIGLKPNHVLNSKRNDKPQLKKQGRQLKTFFFNSANFKEKFRLFTKIFYIYFENEGYTATVWSKMDTKATCHTKHS